MAPNGDCTGGTVRDGVNIGDRFGDGLGELGPRDPKQQNEGTSKQRVNN